MKNIIYYIVFCIWFLMSLLPLWLLYRLSDGLYYFIYYIIKYRRHIVLKNLTDSFPEKSPEEIIYIEKKFYSWFCDYIVECIKLFSISKSNIQRRMKFEGVEDLEQSVTNGHPCSVYLGHYCNWEWVTSLPLRFGDSAIFAQIYHELENPAFNKLFLYLRGRFNAHSIEMENSFRTIMTWKKENKLSIVGYISDQVPGYPNIHCFVDFLNHDTPVLTGAERIARLIDSDVYYADITRPKRGYYVCKFKRIAEPEGGYTKFHYTREYFRLLEQSIKNAPQYWLWSHNRWKRTREEFNKMYSEEERQRMLNRL